VKHDGPLDPVVVSAILDKVSRRRSPDRRPPRQAVDRRRPEQVGQYLAERLRPRPRALRLQGRDLESEAEQKKQPGVVLAADGKSRAGRPRGGRRRSSTLDVLTLPAVVTCDLRLNKPALRLAARHHEGEEEAGGGAPAPLGVDLRPGRP